MQKWSCIDKNGDPIPWYTYPAIEYLSNLDFSQKTILEWGGGNSSLFWAKRCKKLITIESSAEWFKVMKKNKMKNQEIYLKTFIDIENPLENYALFPKILNKLFDVIVIDGGAIQNKTTRPKCTRIAKNLLNYSARQGAMIIFDNSDWYPLTCETLRQNNLIQIDFHGFAPINAYTHTTSIFLTHNFSFKSINDRQPHYSKAALHYTNDFLGE